MNVTVRLFAAARDAVGHDTVNITVDATASTVGRLRTALVQKHPELASIVTHSLFAINEEYCRDEDQIPSHATVACIPPVSGG